MPTFLAVTGKGLVEPLQTELESLGAERIERVGQGIQFDTNWKGCYNINLNSRLAARVLKPVLDFIAYTPEELYAGVSKHDFTKYIDVGQTIKVDCTVGESKMHDQRHIAMIVKDAIVDQFREDTGDRPDVDTKNPDLKIFIKGYKNKFSVAIDTSGEGLYLRGYRMQGGDAPLRENLAAGLVRLSEWDETIPIVDPMCGSGTILIEAALQALKIAPGSSRRKFGFEKLKGFKEDEWVMSSRARHPANCPSCLLNFTALTRTGRFCKQQKKTPSVQVSII
jgi:23S rRNA G2445 N2-methylase RlmL